MNSKTKPRLLSGHSSKNYSHLSDIIDLIWRINMARGRLQFIAPALVLPFISSTLLSVEMVQTEETEQLVEIVHFEVSADLLRSWRTHLGIL